MKNNFLLSKWIIAVIAVTAITIFSIQFAKAQTWTSLNGPQVGKNVKDVALSNGATPTIYAADNSYLLKSTDGAASFKATGSVVNTPMATVCQPDNAANVVAGGTGFLWNSIDGGSLWSFKSGYVIDNLTSVRFAVSPITTAQMYMGRNYYNDNSKAFWKSINSGVDWDRMENFYWNTTIKDISPYPVQDVPQSQRDNILWVCGSGTDKGLWKSNNAGVTWDSPLLDTDNLISVAVMHKAYPSNSHLYVVKSTGEVVKSTNNGADWTPVFAAGNTVRFVRINTNNNYIYLATNNGVYRSTNEGSSFSQVNSGLGTDINVLSLAVNSSNVLLAGTTGSMYKSTNNGVTWTNVGIMNSSSVFATSTSVWTVSRDNSYVGTYTGSSWTTSQILSPGANIISEQVHRNQGNGAIFTSGTYNANAEVFRSMDGGSTFSVDALTTTGGKFLGVKTHPSTYTQMFMFGGTTISGVWKSLFSSANSGAAWNALSPPWETSGVYVNDLIELNISTGRLYAATSNGRIYRSDDNGATWVSGSSPVLDMGSGNIAYSVDAATIATTKVYAAGTNGIWRSTNSGSLGTWTQVKTGSYKVVTVCPANQMTGEQAASVSTDGSALYYTVNGGSSWINGTGNLPPPINNLYSDLTSANLYAATKYGIYKITAPTGLPTTTTTADGFDVKLEWNAIANASGYHLRIYKGAQLVTEQNSLTGLSYYPTCLVTGGTYFWDVAAHNPAGETNFSTQSSFTVSASQTITQNTITLNNRHPVLS
ncbi:MAG: hypothetical protein HYZ34_06105 [Ignavibacteriae bacterium]|nr:hypothetical protein [Ignavibacteriota bacterium]